MDIYTLKTQLEQAVQPAPLAAPVRAEQAWTYFKAGVGQRLDEESCEEVGFSASVAAYFDGKTAHYDEDLFQIYFGRLIDAETGRPWRTAEINFYYQFEMNAQLRRLLAQLKQQDVETAFCTSEDEGIIRQKIETVFGFADEQQTLWEAVRTLAPAKSSFSFWIQ